MGSKYTKLSRGTKVNFDVHVTSMVQCFISIALLIPHLNNPHLANRHADPVNSLLGKTDFGGLACALTVGYFIWDIYVCVRYFSLFGVGFLFHGIAAMYAFLSGSSLTDNHGLVHFWHSNSVLHLSISIGLLPNCQQELSVTSL